MKGARTPKAHAKRPSTAGGPGAEAVERPAESPVLGATPPPPPPRPRRRRRLSSLRNVQTALADQLWLLETGQAAPGLVRTLIYGYSVLAGVIQGSDLEARIAALEGKRP